MTQQTPTIDRVLVTGATGFVGSALVPKLREEGFEVVGASRHPDEAKRERPEIEWVHLDVDDEATITEAMRGCQGAYYLIHSMGSDEEGDFEEREARAARHFASAAARAGLERVVYLGGVLPEQEPSKHLRSREETGRILREEGEVPCVELRASMIIGHGSASWRIVRDLCARLPAMLLPSWLESRTEPVALEDVVHALRMSMKMPLKSSLVLGIPGPELLTLKEVVKRTSALLGSDPVMIDVPLLSPALSKGWLTLVTRTDPAIAGELVEGLRHDLIARDELAWDHFAGEHELVSFDEAAARALEGEERDLSPLVRELEAMARGLSSTSQESEAQDT